jgi:hypothetical protein
MCVDRGANATIERDPQAKVREAEGRRDGASEMSAG